MNDFKWKHYQGEIILGCVLWYCKYGISYRDLEEMMLETGPYPQGLVRVL